MKKLVKIGGILGGLFVFSEFCGIIGEMQSLYAMHEICPDEVDDYVEDMCDDDTNKALPRYAKLKLKILRSVTKFYIENDVLGFLVGR